MLDNTKTRLVLDIKYGTKWIEKLRKNFAINRTWKNDFAESYRGLLYKTEYTTFDEMKKLPSLEVRIILKETETIVIISNSLRKWYNGKSLSYHDLDKNKLEACLKLISEKLHIPYELFLESRLTKVEWGASLVFKENFQGFMSCIHDHKFIKLRCAFGDETIEFRGDNKSVIFYDKLEELQSNSGLKKRPKEILKRNIYVLRYEIKVSKVCSYDFARDFMGTYRSVLENWNLIVDEWQMELQNIKFVDNMTPEISKYLSTNPSETKVREFLIYKGIKNIGLENFKVFLEKKCPKAKKPRAQSKYLEIFGGFRKMDKKQYNVIFLNEIRAMVEKLKIEAS